MLSTRARTMDHFGYLFGAYTLIFFAIFLYVAFIWRLQCRLSAEIDQLQSELRSLRNSAPASSTIDHENDPSR
jgi:CcmD family protein